MSSKSAIPLLFFTVLTVSTFFSIVPVKNSIASEANTSAVIVVPNTHGTVSGWLTDFNSERNYMANDYAEHLEYSQKDPNYVVAISEVPNLIALAELRPDILPALKNGLDHNRAELVNAFFDETDVNLLLGETLIRSGVEGIEWQQTKFGKTPQFGWLIDSNGIHSQIPEILNHLGVKAFVYSRNSPEESPSQRWRSSSGAEVLGFATVYANWRGLFADPAQIDTGLVTAIKPDADALPNDAPLLWLVGASDYSGAPKDPHAVKKLLASWHELGSNRSLKFAIPSEALDYYLEHPSITAQLPVISRETIYSYNAFWAAAPKAKQQFRSAETGLLAAESIVALVSSAEGTPYPTCQLRDAWWTLLMNSDRALLWGAGSGEPFYGAKTWNVQDRNDSISAHIAAINEFSLSMMGKKAAQKDRGVLSIINSVGVRRVELISVPLRKGTRPSNLACAQGQHEGRALCSAKLKPFGATHISFETGNVEADHVSAVPDHLNTGYYQVGLSPQNGALLFLRRKGSAADLIVGQELKAERQIVTMGQSDFLVARSHRETIASPPYAVKAKLITNELGWKIVSEFGLFKNTRIRRTMSFYRGDARIDVLTETTNLPDDILFTDNFRLHSAITTERRGLPYGFSVRTLPDPNVPPARNLLSDHHEPYGLNNRTVPAVLWSAHETSDLRGLAILDRGIPGRESNGDEATILLVNTASSYRGKPNTWISGRGTMHFQYSLLPYEGDWLKQNLPQRALAHRAPILISHGTKSSPFAQPMLISSDNFLIESVRRIGTDLEVRGVESKGKSGIAELNFRLPYAGVRRVDALGNAVAGLLHSSDGSVVKFRVEPQQIATLRFSMNTKANHCSPLQSLKSLIPLAKQEGLFVSHRELIGHPPE